MKVDGTSSRRFLRFLSLTALWAEGGGGGFAADFKEKGRGSAAGCVEGLYRKVLKMDRPLAGGFLSLTALRAEGCGIALRAMSFIIPPSARRFRGWWWRPSGAIFKGRASPPFNLPTPIQGGGWRAERDGRGRLYLWVRSAVFRCWLFAHLVPACRAPASFGNPLPPLRGPPPPASGGRQGIGARPSPP